MAGSPWHIWQLLTGEVPVLGLMEAQEGDAGRVGGSPRSHLCLGWYNARKVSLPCQNKFVAVHKNLVVTGFDNIKHPSGQDSHNAWCILPLWQVGRIKHLSRILIREIIPSLLEQLLERGTRKYSDFTWREGCSFSTYDRRVSVVLVGLMSALVKPFVMANKRSTGENRLSSPPIWMFWRPGANVERSMAAGTCWFESVLH